MAEREYGIGRVPADVDPIEETFAELEAERLQPSPRRDPERLHARCPKCGEAGPIGEHPFSTYGFTYDERRGTQICDDCGA